MLKKPHKLRVVVLAALLCVLGSLVAARLYYLQVYNGERYAARADRQQTMRVTIQPERGDILDRLGRPLATSTGSLSIYVDPKFFQAPEANIDLDALSRQLAYYTNIDADTIHDRLSGTRVVALARQMDNDVAQRAGDLIEDYGVTGRGWWFHRESKRLYPRHLAPHVIGFTGTDADGDNHGLEGLEKLYNDELHGQRIESQASRSAISQVMQPFRHEDLVAARGETLVLTLDAAIQQSLESALRQAVEENDADAAAGIVQDVETGGILALASYPTFDPEEYSTAATDGRRNRVLTDPLETGSVAKLFTAAMLLDANLVAPNTMFDCEGGRWVIGRRAVRDSHELGVVPFTEVMRHSSNIGIIKAAQVLENDSWYASLRRFGLGQRSGIDLPGEGNGLLYPPERWTALSRSSLPMGYEMALTSIQIVNGITGLVNGGELLKPYIVKERRDARGNVVWRAERTVITRMVRPTTSEIMRNIMEDVVVNGTGKKAAVTGFRVGGKTGTTRKSQVLSRREYIASFAGAMPIDRPRFSVYCYVDNPKAGKYYAADVAAPVFQQVARTAALQLGLVPTMPPEADAIASAAPAGPIHQAAVGIDEAPTVTLPGTMPDLHGLSMAEVRRALAGHQSPVRFLGTGRVADQSPAPGASFDAANEVLIVFQSDAARAPSASLVAINTAATLPARTRP